MINIPKNSADIEIGDLRCNYLQNPLGVETASPLFSWALSSNKNGQYQQAYRIIAASAIGLLSEGKVDLWDSGRVESTKTTFVAYAGAALKSRQRCYWQVCVFDMNDTAVWSEVAFFEMGLLHAGDWSAKWICATQSAADIDNPVPAPLLRKEFSIDKKILNARVYVSGLGYYELSINGKKVSDEVLCPPFTKYDETVLYNTYDVTGALTSGENVAGIILGNGWYNPFTKVAWHFEQAPWRNHPIMIFQMHIKFSDGSEMTVVSDKSWRCAKGPIIFDGLRNGEFYDARLEQEDWNMPGYNEISWNQAQITKSPGGLLKSAQLTPIRITKTIKPVSLDEVKPGVWVYDLGQNIAGWAKITASGEAGSEITLRYAEKIREDGMIDQSNIDTCIKSGAAQTDKYIFSGKGTETWHPRFTYHGFQYVEITGYTGKLTSDNLAGQAVHTDFEVSGEFECSDELLNKIQQCAGWSTLNNYHGIPTDCPHREKNGWTGDASLSAEQVLFNFNPATAYTKWMLDFKDAQHPSGQLPGIVPTGGCGYGWGSGPAWDSAMILIPWYMYLYLGDISILEKMYDNFVSYINFMTSMADGYLVDFGLGDWCPPVGRAEDYKCPSVVTDTAYYYVDALVASKTAKLLGKSGDTAEFSRLAENIRDTFRRNFLDAKTGIVSGNCQTSMSCALYQGLINDSEKPVVLERLVEKVSEQDYHIDCGILGTKYIMHALTDSGRADLAYRIASQTTFPSWGHWIMQGATTLWETWNGDSSRDHHMFSDISAWFYKGLAGINPDENAPGFRHIIIRPNPAGGLTWVRAWHRSMYGIIRSCWKYENGQFSIDVAIPVGCSATLYLPVKGSTGVKELKSGNYCFSCNL